MSGAMTSGSGASRLGCWVAMAQRHPLATLTWPRQLHASVAMTETSRLSAGTLSHRAVMGGTSSTRSDV
eukprot:10047874-Lingulodinium_polyedra.AAC.1